MKQKMTRSSVLWKVTRNDVSEAWGMSHPDGALRATGVRHIYLIIIFCEIFGYNFVSILICLTFCQFFCQFYVTTFFLLHICYIFSFMGPTFSKSTPISTLSRIFIIYNTLLETCMFEFRLFKRINQHNCPLSSPSTNITSN